MNRPINHTQVVEASEARALIQAAGIEIKTVQGRLFAPSWAIAITEIDISSRQKITALRRLARDAELRLWVSPLLSILQTPQERRDLMASLQKESEKTVVCTCGARFTSTIKWQDHLTTSCPKRQRDSLC